MNLLRVVFRPAIADRPSLRRYVVAVTVLAWVVAVGVDVVNHLFLHFTSWADALREWSISTGVVLTIAIPVALSLGRTHLKLHEAKLEAERLSRTDPLTGLANRRAFYEAAPQQGAVVLALIIADIDRFKSINDKHGHAAGDMVIKAVGAQMRHVLGDLGVVARIGGEEFALVASAGAGSGEAIRARLQLFRQQVANEPVRIEGSAIGVSVSIGVAVRSDLSFDALYAAADKALYVAKAAGRNRVVDYDEIDAFTARKSEDSVEAETRAA